MNRSYQGSVLSPVRTVLQLEGLTVLVACATAYANLHANWWLFAALFFVPDISFVAYLGNPRTGAVAYNALHTYIAPLLAALTAYFIDNSLLINVAIIWTAHIGFDRAAGYGLKYGSAFGDTHLGYKGRA